MTLHAAMQAATESSQMPINEKDLLALSEIKAELTTLEDLFAEIHQEMGLTFIEDILAESFLEMLAA